MGMMAQYSKSSRAACSKCSEKIMKNEVRLGLPKKWGGGVHGYINCWQHLTCTRVPTPDTFDAATSVFAFDSLTKEDQKKVSEELKRTDTPACLVAIDPNDPKYCKNTEKLPMWEQPIDINRPLLRFQREGYGWMMRQELGSDLNGGILAAEMGMGKTIQTISMIVERKMRRHCTRKHGANTAISDSCNDKALEKNSCAVKARRATTRSSKEISPSTPATKA